MNKTIAVIGAGPGIGYAVAERFGREGFRVALLARSADSLDDYVARLAALNVDAAGFRADVLDHQSLTDALEQATVALGPIGVIEYGPTPPPGTMAAPLDITVDNVQLQFNYAVLGAITAVRAVLPGMHEAGDGALLFTTAYSAVEPVPFSSNFAVANAGLRSYVQSLHGALKGQSIYAGILEVGGIVDKGDGGETTPALEMAKAGGLSVIPSTEIADAFWDMVATRDRVEHVAGDLEALHRSMTIAAETL